MGHLNLVRGNGKERDEQHVKVDNANGRGSGVEPLVRGSEGEASKQTNKRAIAILTTALNVSESVSLSLLLLFFIQYSHSRYSAKIPDFFPGLTVTPNYFPRTVL